MVNGRLVDLEYENFKVLYILKVKDETENFYILASIGDEIIGFNLFENEIKQFVI